MKTLLCKIDVPIIPTQIVLPKQTWNAQKGPRGKKKQSLCNASFSGSILKFWECNHQGVCHIGPHGPQRPVCLVANHWIQHNMMANVHQKNKKCTIVWNCLHHPSETFLQSTFPQASLRTLRTAHVCGDWPMHCQ